MMDSSSFVKLKPTWSIQGPYDIHVCLHCDLEDAKESSPDASSYSQSVMVTLTSSGSEPCLLQVTCKPGVEVLSAVLQTNARHVEIQDETDGYLATVRGERVKACNGEEDTAVVYRKEVELDRPCSRFKLKFVSLSEKHTLHIHQIHTTLRRNTSAEPSGPSLPGQHGNIDMDRVRDLLSSQQPICDRAENLMSTIEQYQKNQSATMQDMQAAVVKSAANQDPGSGDLGVMGQMAGLLSSLSMTRAKDQVPASPDAMMQMMSSFVGGGGGGDAAGSESMYGALKLMCSDVTRIRKMEQEADAKQTSTSPQDGEERNKDEEGASGANTSSSALDNQALQALLSSTEERLMSRLETRIDTLQSHFDLRLNKLESLLCALTTHATPMTKAINGERLAELDEKGKESKSS